MTAPRAPAAGATPAREETLDVDAIEARANEATPGPWVTHMDHLSERAPEDCVCRGYSLGRMHQQDVDVELYAPHGTYAKRDHRVGANAEFVAHAREDVPALVAEVRALRAALRERDAAREDAARWRIVQRGLFASLDDEGEVVVRFQSGDLDEEATLLFPELRDYRGLVLDVTPIVDAARAAAEGRTPETLP